jgi:hypothetical protein
MTRRWALAYLAAAVINGIRICLNVLLFLAGYWLARKVGASAPLAVGVAVVYALTGEGRPLTTGREEKRISDRAEAVRRAAA